MAHVIWYTDETHWYVNIHEVEQVDENTLRPGTLLQTLGPFGSKEEAHAASRNFAGNGPGAGPAEEGVQAV